MVSNRNGEVRVITVEENILEQNDLILWLASLPSEAGAWAC